MKVTEFLEQQSVPYELHEHPPAYTAQEMAAEEHVSGNMTAKAVLVRAGDRHVLCVLPASYKLDLDKVAKALDADSVELADERDLAKIFPDVEVGAEPPFGNLYDLPTLMDANLSDDEEIIFQADDHRHAVQMKTADYVRLAAPKIADLAVHL